MVTLLCSNYVLYVHFGGSGLILINVIFFTDETMLKSCLGVAILAAASAPCYGLHAPSASVIPKGPMVGQDARSAAPTLQHLALNAQPRAQTLRGGAPKPAAVAEVAKPWYSAIWNESVELGVLFGLWYWGNVYCECSTIHESFFPLRRPTIMFHVLAYAPRTGFLSPCGCAQLPYFRCDFTMNFARLTVERRREN